MAFGATNVCVLTVERKCAGAVHGDVESGWLEASVAMAGRTIRPGGASGKLFVVGVGVAILATIVSHRPVEIRGLMAGLTRDTLMLSRQREFGEHMVKALTQVAVLPSARVVATIAGAPETGLSEGAPVGIGMTRHTPAPADSLELCGGLPGLRPMALLASYFFMEAGQWERSL
jgi:hypothetical protein